VIDEVQESSAVNENSVYRYDEPALLEALKQARIASLKAGKLKRSGEAA
jgi:hypothetical protein